MSLQIELPVDLNREIFKGILEDVRFCAWKQGHRRWQLHLSGGPGVGKTVLAYLIAEHLQEQSTSTTTLISVQNYLRDGLQPSGELLLGLIHDGFYRTDSATNSAKNALAPVSSHITAPRANSSQTSQYMDAALPNSSTSYLIIDDFDQLERDVQNDVEHGLNLMEGHSLRVLLTRAVPKFKSLPLISALCDRCGSPGENGLGLIIYWKCQNCFDGPDAREFFLCDKCNSENSACDPAGHRMCESESHINIDINTDASSAGLRQFAQFDLEKEYSSHFKPHDINSIVDRSEPNINLVKLRLDQVREIGSLQDTMAVSDRLPRGVIAFFDAAIERICAKNVKQRDQTLLALVALSEAKNMALDDLEQLLRDSGMCPAQLSQESHPHVHEILESARGLIYRMMNGYLPEPDRHRVLIYNDDLWWYIHDDYNKDLVLAKKRLREVKSKTSVLESPSALMDDGNAREDVAFTAEPITSNSEKPNLNTTALSSCEAHVSGDCDQFNDVQSVCASCRQNIFQGKILSGVHNWVNLNSDGSRGLQCPFCFYVYKALETSERTNDKGATTFRWSIRSMGRTSNDRDILSLTLRSEDQSASHASKRFVFMPRSQIGYTKSKMRLGKSTNLCDSGAQISKWLQECNENHAHCGRQQSKPYVPKRLILIDAVELGVHQIIYAQKNGIVGPYVTLSHSWGRISFLELTTKNEEGLTKGFSSLGNKNFEEAIEVARHLGVKYIWIDSLCICQREGGDFKKEGQKMHLVYRNSLCNIVAADSNDCTGGLFRRRSLSTILSVDYIAGKNELLAAGAWKILEEDLWAKQLLKSPIYTRGWVFQERMLSPRIIHFARSQVFWDCSTLSACESLPEGLPFPLEINAATDRHWRRRLQKRHGKVKTSDLAVEDSLEVFWKSAVLNYTSYVVTSQMDEINAATDRHWRRRLQKRYRRVKPSDIAVEDSLETFWKSAVLNYTSCDLTHQTDKTVAVWSVAKLIRDLRELENEYDQDEDEYACGLWAKALHEQLAWRVKDVKEGSRMEVLQANFPSWSWASVSGPIQLQSRLSETRCYSVKNHKDEDVRFGNFKKNALNRNKQPEFAESNSLALRGHMVPGFLSEDITTMLHTFEVDKTLHTSETISFKVVLDEVLGDRSSNPLRCQCLILAAKKVSKSNDRNSNDPGTYSGSGLILIANCEYATYSQLQREKLESELKQDVQLPGESLDDTKWRQKGLRERIKACHKWLEDSNLKNKQIPSRVGFDYRRIGVVHFENISKDSWTALEAVGKTNLWLD